MVDDRFNRDESIFESDDYLTLLRLLPVPCLVTLAIMLLHAILLFAFVSSRVLLAGISSHIYVYSLPALCPSIFPSIAVFSQPDCF